MYEIELHTNDSQAHVIDFPEHMGELRFEQFVNFVAAQKRFVKWKEEMEEEIDPYTYRIGEIQFLIEVVNDVFSIDLDAGNIPLGEVPDHEKPAIDKTGDSLQVLYSNLNVVIASYQPLYRTEEDYTFTYKGDTWAIPITMRNAITGRTDFETMPAARVIEALEAMRYFQNNEKNDDQGSMYYSSTLSQLAALCRCDKYAFPYDSQEKIDQYITRWSYHFRDITADIALDVAGWINGMFDAYKGNPAMRWFFNKPQKALDPETSGKIKAENEARFGRAGYRFIYQRIISSGKFQQPNYTPLESARRAPFGDVLREVSLENALD